MTASGNGRNVQLQRVLQAATVIGAIFSMVFLVLLIVNGYRQYVPGAKTYSYITDLKMQLLSQPDNENLVKEIREVDRDYRADKLRQIDFSSLAALMLLISAAVTIGAIKWRTHLAGIHPEPGDESEEPSQNRSLGHSRWALSGVVFLLMVAGFTLVRKTPSEWIAQLETGMSNKPDYASPEELSRNWHRFRGFAGAGITSFTDIPEEWDIATGKNILWKAPVQMSGFNSPIVWQDRVFISGANEEKREVFCYDAATGSILWSGQVPTAPMGSRKLDVMEDTGYAASSMATDGIRVYAMFATGDLAAFDFKGRLLWHKSLGIPVNLYGHATSLEVWQNRVLVQYDQASAADEKSRLYAFDGASGNLVWEAKRPVPNSWTSPIVVKVENDYQLITTGDPWVIAYDPGDGKEIWRADCVKGDVGASSILAGNLVVAIAPDMFNVAIRTGGMGDISETHIAWENDDVGPSIVSPVADESRVFFLDTYGTLYVVNLTDGKLAYEFDYNENVNASPTLVSGKLYVLDIEGTMHIGTADETEFTLESSNELNERCYATPAFMPGRIYIRGEENLYCIGNNEP